MVKHDEHNSTDSDHRVTYAMRTPAINRAVRRALGHGVCETCRRVVFVTKMGRFAHKGDPIVEEAPR